MAVASRAAPESTETLKGWRADLRVNAQRRGLAGLVVALIVSPPFRAVTLVRLGRYFVAKGLGGRLIGVLIARRLVHLFGCYISPKAQIGAALRLPHPTSIVIGEGCFVGDNVVIYQNVTLGRRSEHDSGYPRVGDGAVLYAGAVIVGDVTIGEGAVVGANSVVLADVPPWTVVAGSPARPVGPSSAQSRKTT